MSDRTKRFPTRTLDEFIGRGLCPCNGCLREALQCFGEPLFGRRVYGSTVEDSYSLDARACKSCGFFVFPGGTFRASLGIMREMYRREAKADRGRPDTQVDVSPQVPTGGGPVMRHSDKQTDFGTGAKRDTDEGKGRPSLISPVLIHRLGVHLAKGAEHYGADNWVKGMPYRRTADSIIRHIFQWLAGDEEEDHLSAVVFGAMCLMTYEIQEGSANPILDGCKKAVHLDDRCRDLKRILASILTPSSGGATLSDDTERNENKAEQALNFVTCKGACGGLTSELGGMCLSCQAWQGGILHDGSEVS